MTSYAKCLEKRSLYTLSEMTIIQALNQALHAAFQRNEKVLAFGEDVGAFGGVFRVTVGLQEKFGEERCFDTPLSEGGIVGFAIGLAQKGFKPIAEIQFADYIFPAYDQIVNEAAKMRYRSGGQYTSSFIIRTPYGGGIHGGLYHSQSVEAAFLHTPGLLVLVPSGPYFAKGLLNAALKRDDPVLFLEPKRLYRSLKEEVPDDYFETPIGKASIAKEGADVTLIGWGAETAENKKAAATLQNQGIDVEVLDLLSLNPLDEEALFTSVQKTGRCVISHEAPKTQGFGAELAALIQEKCLLFLKAPILRATGFDTPFPHTLEEAYLPGEERIIRTIQKVINN